MSSTNGMGSGTSGFFGFGTQVSVYRSCLESLDEDDCLTVAFQGGAQARVREKKVNSGARKYLEDSISWGRRVWNLEYSGAYELKS